MGSGFFSAPSQSSLAVAGVQLASRQQCSPVPFFHTSPELLTQLSTVWANAPDTDAARAADAKSDATLFNFFIIFLSRGRRSLFCKTSESESEMTGKPRLYGR